MNFKISTHPSNSQHKQYVNLTIPSKTFILFMIKTFDMSSTLLNLGIILSIMSSKFTCVIENGKKSLPL